MREGPTTALERAVERMWPDASVELVRRGRPASGPGDPVREQFVLIPNAGAPRMLLPCDRRAASAAVQRYNAAVGTGELLNRSVLSAGLRLGAGSLLPDRLAVRGGGSSLIDHLANVVGEPLTASITVGNARANRKPVLGLFGRSGRLVAYAKVGDTDVARGHVEGEASALSTIQGLTWRSLVVPDLIHAGEWQGMFVLVMSALNGSVRAGLRRSGDFPGAAMTELSAAFDAGDSALSDTELVLRLRRTTAGFGTDQGRRVDRALARLLDRYGSTQVRTGAWHGDFTPWNLAWGRRGRVMLWDWERFSVDSLFGMDRIHYLSQTAVRSSGFSVPVLRDALTSIGAARGTGPDRHRATVASYAAELATRYQAAAEGAGGELIVEQAGVVAEVLEVLLDQGDDA